jgi:hypothetical protein
MSYVIVALVFLMVGALGSAFALANNPATYARVRGWLGK